jgi:glycosyltransferase involved in cell wall biosynthesis
VVPEKWRSAVKNIFWHQFVLPQWLKREGIEVLHVPSYRRMLFRAPCALVSTIHDLAPFHVRGKYDLARMLYGRVVVKHLARRQSAIVAVSTHTAEDVERFFAIPVSNQRVVLNGLDHTRFNLGDKASARKQAVTQWQLDRPYFLYVSRLEHPAKNHVRLIEAFNRFKTATGSDWQLALGGSDWHGAEVIHATAAASPFAKDIRFLGFVSDAALPDLYRAAEAFVYPSLFEGFGLPPVEAMACGCPVISSAAGALSEVVAGAALIIQPDSVESIAHALSRLAVDGIERGRLMLLGLKNARRFEWKDNAAQVLSIYQTAVRRPNQETS